MSICFWPLVSTCQFISILYNQMGYREELIGLAKIHPFCLDGTSHVSYLDNASLWISMFRIHGILGPVSLTGERAFQRGAWKIIRVVVQIILESFSSIKASKQTNNKESKTLLSAAHLCSWHSAASASRFFWTKKFLFGYQLSSSL